MKAHWTHNQSVIMMVMLTLEHYDAGAPWLWTRQNLGKILPCTLLDTLSLHAISAYWGFKEGVCVT